MESKEFIAKEVAKVFAITAIVALSSILMGKLLTIYQIAGEVAAPVGMLGLLAILFLCCAISRIEEIVSWSRAKKIVTATIVTFAMMIIVIIATTVACIVIDQFYFLLPCTIWELIVLGLLIVAVGTTAYMTMVVARGEQEKTHLNKTKSRNEARTKTKTLSLTKSQKMTLTAIRALLGSMIIVAIVAMIFAKDAESIFSAAILLATAIVFGSFVEIEQAMFRRQRQQEEEKQEQASV